MAPSVGRTTAEPPSPATSCAAASSPSTPRASIPTLPPRRPKARAVARPTPPAAPVTTTVSRLPGSHLPGSRLLGTSGALLLLAHEMAEFAHELVALGENHGIGRGRTRVEQLAAHGVSPSLVRRTRAGIHRSRRVIPPAVSPILLGRPIA